MPAWRPTNRPQRLPADRGEVAGGDCINVSGDGSTNSPFVVSPIISEDALNALTCRDDGLFVESSEGKRPPVIVIAAANTTSALVESADFHCDGVDDHVEIQAASDLLQAGPGWFGGTIFLLPGTYFPTASITVGFSINLIGSNPSSGTIIRSLGGNLGFALRLLGGNVLSDFRLSVDGPTAGIEIGSAGKCTLNRIEAELTGNNMQSPPPNFPASFGFITCDGPDVIITDCLLEGRDNRMSVGNPLHLGICTLFISSGFSPKGVISSNKIIGGVAIDGASNYRITDNLFDGSFMIVPQLQSQANATSNIITNNIFHAGDSNCIRVLGTQFSMISDNNFIGRFNPNIDAIRVDRSTYGVSIVDNTFDGSIGTFRHAINILPQSPPLENEALYVTGNDMLDSFNVSAINDQGVGTVLTPGNRPGGSVVIRDNNGPDTGLRPRLNFIDGTDIIITTTDDSVNNEIDITISSAVTGATPPTGPAGGDLGSTYPDPTVHNLTELHLFDAKGDLLVAPSDDQVDRLPVGADGLVLTADSTATLGVVWGTPTITGGGPPTGPAGGILSGTYPDPDFSSAAFGLAGYPEDVAAVEDDGVAVVAPRADHVHAHGSGYLPNAHHDEAHLHDGIDGSGSVDHTNLTGVTADQHHDEAHLHDGIDGSGTISHDDLTGVTADQHHTETHAHDGIDGSGTISHDDLTGVTADQHHTETHAHDGIDGSGTISHDDLTGVTADQHHTENHATRHEVGGADLLTGLLDATARTTIRKNTGVDVGSRRRLNFIEGTNVTFTIADDAVDEEVDITIDATGGAADPITCWVIGCSGAHAANGWAELSHEDRWSGGPGNGLTYGFLHNSNGGIIINGSTAGSGVRLLIDGSTTGETRLDPGGVLRVSLGMDAMRIGDDPVHAGTTSIRRDGLNASGNYGLLINANGFTILNSASGQPLELRQNNIPRVSILTGNSPMMQIRRPDGTLRYSFDDVQAILGLGVLGAARVGSWTANASYVAFQSEDARGVHGSGAGPLYAGRVAGDSRTYITPNGTATNWIQFRTMPNAINVASFGNGNVDHRGLNMNICMALPSGVGNTVTWGTGSSQIQQTTSSGTSKKNIRNLRDTPRLQVTQDDTDLPISRFRQDGIGATRNQNPIFELRPVRFNWVQHPGGLNGYLPGIVNGDYENSLFPDGVAGLISEEVREVMPDVVHVIPPRPEWHWSEEDGLPSDDPETGEPILYRPATPEKVLSIDPDRMIAYLVDAIQYLKEEIDQLKKEGIDASEART